MILMSQQTEYEYIIVSPLFQFTHGLSGIKWLQLLNLFQDLSCTMLLPSAQSTASMAHSGLKLSLGDLIQKAQGNIPLTCTCVGPVLAMFSTYKSVNHTFFRGLLRLQSGFDVHVFLTSFLAAHNSENIYNSEW